VCMACPPLWRVSSSGKDEDARAGHEIRTGFLLRPSYFKVAGLPPRQSVPLQVFLCFLPWERVHSRTLRRMTSSALRDADRSRSGCGHCPQRKVDRVTPTAEFGRGFGITRAWRKNLEKMESDVLTGGNHSWYRKEILEFLPHCRGCCGRQIFPDELLVTCLYVGSSNG